MEWLKINEDGEVEFVSEEIKLVPEVQELMTLKYNKGPKDADGRKKFRMKAELKYMYLNYSRRGPYRDYSPTERLEESKRDCGFDTNWKESEELKAVVAKYTKASPNKLLRLLHTSEGVLDKLDTYFQNIDFSLKDDKGALLYEPKEVMDSLNKLPRLASTLQELEQQVNLGSIGLPKSKGDHELGWMALPGNEHGKRTSNTDE